MNKSHLIVIKVFVTIYPLSMSKNQIVISDLSKVYDNKFSALKKVSLKVKQGEILAMLGPNGAGKTTLISIICGIAKPSSEIGRASCRERV